MIISNRNYNMTDADLNVFSGSLVVKMTRDTTQFASRGVNTAAITAFGVLATAFGALPTDSYYQADISLAVQSKNSVRVDAEKAIRAIVGCAKIKWGVGSPQDKKFGAGSMTKDDDKKFLTTCRQVVTTATEYLTELTPVGLTQAMITGLTTLANSFQSDLNSIATAQEARDIATQNRITKGNELYGYVTRYCEIGKIIWIDVDEAKYNDYVIYDTVHHGLPKPQNLVATLQPVTPPKVTLTWDVVTGATNYDIYVSLVEPEQPSGDFNLLVNITSNFYSGLITTGKRNYYKIKARNDSQVSLYSDEVFVEEPAV
jgi:hypothetical protein